MKHFSIRIRMLVAGALAAASLAACGGGSSSPPSPPPPPPVATGTVSVAMINTRACDVDFAAINFTITKLRLSKASPVPPVPGPVDPAWVDVPVDQAHKINVANLSNGVLGTVGQATVEVGHYTQLALVLDTSSMANTVVPSAGDAEHALEVPGPLQSGLVVYTDFDVVAGQKADLVLSIDSCNLVGKSSDGNYTLNASGIYQAPAAPNGITGFISPAAMANHVLVTAQRQWGIVASTRPDPATGEFWLSHLSVADYNVVITADNSAASAIGSVPVAETATTPISTSASPIQLAPSKMGSISGNIKVLYVHSAAYGSAMQHIVSGDDAWWIQQKTVAPLTDTYTLSNLPLAAPQYAPYSSTLPLTFSASSTVTPGTYIVVASGGGLLPRSEVVDISTGDKTGVDFSLVPSGP